MADGLDPAEVEQDIPVVHRLAILYLVLPVGVWLAGWFEWWFGIPATALLAFGLWKAMSGCWKLRLSTTAFVVLLMAAGWVMLTAAGGVLLLDNYDWPKHRAIFTDLGQFAWPVRLPDYLQAHAASHPSTDPLLRYYIGYYPTFPILGVFRLKGQPKRDSGSIVRSCKASQSPVYPIRDAFAVVEHPSCPSSSSSCPLPVG